MASQKKQIQAPLYSGIYNPHRRFMDTNLRSRVRVIQRRAYKTSDWLVSVSATVRVSNNQELLPLDLVQAGNSGPSFQELVKPTTQYLTPLSVLPASNLHPHFHQQAISKQIPYVYYMMGPVPASCLNTLPVDILIDIFKSLSSFSDVPSLVRAHSAFNAVWKANFNEIAPFIAQKNFQPWDDALKLMLEQKNRDDDVIALPGPYMRLSKEDIAQMKHNARYINTLQEKHEEWKKKWWKSNLSDSEILRFRRATYRVWKFMLTITLPRCEAMLEDFSITEVIEIQAAARDFDVYIDYEIPGLPDFSELFPGTAVSSLESILRRRITDYGKYDPELDLDEVHELKGEYQKLRMQDPIVKGKECVESVEKLMEYEKRWREKNV